MPSPTGVRKKDPPARKPPGPDLSKTFVLCGVSGIGERSNERLIDSRGEIDWASLKGANIRIIEDDEHRLTLLLRHACASDCRIVF